MKDKTFLIGTQVSGLAKFGTDTFFVQYAGVAISKIDTAGNILSAKLLVDGEGTKFVDMQIDSEKNMIISGSFVNTCKIGDTTYFGGNGAYFLTKADSMGKVIWTKIFQEPFLSVHGAGPWSIAVTPDNSVCLSGTFNYDSLDLHDTVLRKTGNGLDAFLIKYNSDGQFTSVRSIHATGWCSRNEVISDDDGALYWWGLYVGKVQMEDYLFQDQGGYNYSSFLFKIASDDVTGLPDFSQPKVSLYPNPTSGTYTIQTNSFHSTTKVVVRDILGNKLFESNFQGETKEIDMNNHAGGIYYVEVVSGGHKIVKKVIIQ